ncbi:heavy-metal-associated domain-containing protein [Silvibacterium sp.]|uniref:heavy-metal-associated domain-containing protein n=1 Tax=Silvibacterium sp. TaxID=1964179 RepID=UPI0039E2632E
MAENTVKLAIEGMHCGACVRRVTQALEGVVGAKVKSVEVGSAEVVLSAGATPEEAAAAVNQIGFPARVAQ